MSAGLTGFSCESLLSLRSDWAHGAWGSLVTYWTLLTNWTVWPGGTLVANHTLSSLLTDSSLKTRITSGPLWTCISWKSGVSLGSSASRGSHRCWWGSIVHYMAFGAVMILGNFVFCEACGIDPFFEFGYFLFDAEQILGKLVDLVLEIASRHGGHEGATESEKKIYVHG